MSRAADWRLAERVGTLFAQLFFIAAGVYLGNQADDWKQERSHREAARATLANFRTELSRNQAALMHDTAYHAQLARGFRPYLTGAAGAPSSVGELFERAGWHGAGTIAFRHTAWDVALASQALTYLDQRLAFEIADVYLAQQRYEEYQLTTQRAVFNPASLRRDGLGSLGLLFGVYYNDAAMSNDPELLHQYAAVIRRVDSAMAKRPK